MNKQEHSNELSSKVMALAYSGFGIIPILLILTGYYPFQGINEIVLIAFGSYFVIWIYLGIKAVFSETPEYSKNSKRVEQIGTALMFGGFFLAMSFTYAIAAIFSISIGMILTLIAILHPSSRIEHKPAHVCPDCGNELNFQKIDGTFKISCPNCDYESQFTPEK